MSFFSKKQFPDGIFSLDPLGKLIIKGLDNIGNTCGKDQTNLNQEIRNNGYVTPHSGEKVSYVEDVKYEKPAVFTDKGLCVAQCQNIYNSNYYKCYWEAGGSPKKSLIVND